MHKNLCTLINLIRLITVIWGLFAVVVVLQHCNGGITTGGTDDCT